MGRTFPAKRKTSYLLLSPDCRQIPLPVHHLLRHRRTRQVHHQVEQQSEVTIRHQETSPKSQNKIQKRDNNRAAEDRLRDLPEWLEECTENLQDTEVPAPAHLSHDSFRIGLQKWHPVSTVCLLTSGKMEMAKYACEPR